VSPPAFEVDYIESAGVCLLDDGIGQRRTARNPPSTGRRNTSMEHRTSSARRDTVACTRWGPLRAL